MSNIIERLVKRFEGGPGTGRVKPAVQDLRHDVRDRLAGEEALSRQHLVEDNTKGTSLSAR